MGNLLPSRDENNKTFETTTTQLRVGPLTFPSASPRCFIFAPPRCSFAVLGDSLKLPGGFEKLYM